MSVATKWGTWEELVLGGAVLRHGTAAWDAVAGELRARTPFPGLFTPQECEAKYEDLQEQYSGCDAWFEELRKRRVAELRRELEKSEDSIGSLQSKLENLNAERGSDGGLYDTSRTESPLPAKNSERLDSFSKEASRDGSSAGSYMVETSRDWSQECQISASVSSQEKDAKADMPENSWKETGVSGVSDLMWGICTKKRGQRKRKSCTIVKEGNMVDVDREDPLVGCDQDVNAPHEDAKTPCEDVKVPCDSFRTPNENSGGHERYKSNDLVLAGIMDSIIEHKGVSIFRRRPESQRRALYKKMIRWHVDLQNIRSRIIDGSISSAKELFRDLLLLANNSLLLYAKNSLEHKSAITLRNLVIKALQECSCAPPTSSDNDSAVTAKPMSLQACSRKRTRRVMISEKIAGAPVLEDGKKKASCEKVPAESCTPLTSSDNNSAVTTKPKSLQACTRKRTRRVLIGDKVAGAPVLEDGKKKASREKVQVESMARKRVIRGRPAKGGRVSRNKERDGLEKERKRAGRR